MLTAHHPPRRELGIQLCRLQGTIAWAAHCGHTTLAGGRAGLKGAGWHGGARYARPWLCWQGGARYVRPRLPWLLYLNPGPTWTGMATTPKQMVRMITARPSIVCATTSPNPTVVSVVTTCGARQAGHCTSGRKRVQEGACASVSSGATRLPLGTGFLGGKGRALRAPMERLTR